MNRGISWSYSEESSTGECTCHEFPDSFDNYVVDKITCIFEEPSHVLPVKKCKIDSNGDGDFSDCSQAFNRNWGDEERIDTEGVIRLSLTRPSHITAIKISSGNGGSNTRKNAVRKLKLQYRRTHYDYSFLDSSDKVKLLEWDWAERPNAIDGNEITTADGIDGLKTIYVTFREASKMEKKLEFSILGLQKCGEVLPKK